MMTDFEKGWLSALIDGEGSIGVFFEKQKTSPRPNVRCVITITNTNRALLKFAQNICGGSICGKNPPGNRKRVYVLTIWPSKLREILPLPLIAKKQQQEILIETLELLDGQGKGGKVKGGAGRTRPLWKDKKLVELKKKMNCFNLRGKKRITNPDDLIKTNVSN